LRFLTFLLLSLLQSSDFAPYLKYFEELAKIAPQFYEIRKSQSVVDILAAANPLDPPKPGLQVFSALLHYATKPLVHTLLLSKHFKVRERELLV